MSSAGEPTPSPGSFDKRWALGVRIASLACISLPWLYFVLSLRDPCADDADATSWFVIAVAWTVPYFIILSQAGFWRDPTKVGLSWFAKAGLSWLVLTCLVFVMNGNILSVRKWAVLGLANAVLAVSAIKAYRSVQPGTRFRKIIFEKWGFLVLPYLLIFGYQYSLALKAAWHPHQVSAARAALRQINAAEDQYFSTYNKGFSANLGALGPNSGSAQPDASATGPLASWVAKAEKTGYTFNYSPGPRNTTGRITSYSVSARCICAGRASYYTDESGVVWVTDENRYANPKDNALNKYAVGESGAASYQNR